MDNKDVKVFDGEVMPEKKIQPQNENMMQIKSNYVAAMIVSKPRIMKNVISAVMEEAEAAKDDFFYGWLVNDNKTKKKVPIEGGTIGLAQAIARNWTNCAIETKVKEFGGEWIFKTTFVDFENGFTTQREFRMLIPQKKPDDKNYERTRNVRFQMGQSKNQRDCIFNSVPRWLKNQAIEVAKKASKSDAKKDTPGKLKKAISSFKSKGISEADLLGYFDKKSIEEFDANIVAQLRNLWVQLTNSETSVYEIKRAAQDVFDQPKESRKRTPEKSKPSDKIKEVKKDPQSDMGKAPVTEAANKTTFMQIVKSFETRGISETELCAYFGPDDLIEMDSEAGLADLRKIASDIEGEILSTEEFKKQAADRFATRLNKK